MQELIEYAKNILFEEYEEGNALILSFMKKRQYTYKDLESFNIGFIRAHNPTPKFIKDNIEYYRSMNLFDSRNNLIIRNRIIIPIKDNNGAYSMLSCRITDDSSDAKYKTIKTPESDRNAILDGFYDNQDHIRSANRVYITEGQFDYRTLYAFGLNNSVAVSGSRLTKEHLEAINSLSQRIEIVLAFDNDIAGKRAISEFIVENFSEWHRLYFIEWDVPKDIAKDPDEYVLKFGIEKFRSLVKPMSEYLKDHDIESLVCELYAKSRSFMMNLPCAPQDSKDVHALNRNRDMLRQCILFWDNYDKKHNSIATYSKYIEPVMMYLKEYLYNSKMYILTRIINSISDIRFIFIAYDFFNSLYPEISKEAYVYLLQKNIKTFEKAGEFLYYAYCRQERIHWLAEKVIATWYLHGINRHYRKHERFKIDITKYSDCGSDIEMFKEFEDLVELGEIYIDENELTDKRTDRTILACAEHWRNTLKI